MGGDRRNRIKAQSHQEEIHADMCQIPYPQGALVLRPCRIYEIGHEGNIVIRINDGNKMWEQLSLWKKFLFSCPFLFRCYGDLLEMLQQNSTGRLANCNKLQSSRPVRRLESSERDFSAGHATDLLSMSLESKETFAPSEGKKKLFWSLFMATTFKVYPRPGSEQYACCEAKTAHTKLCHKDVLQLNATSCCSSLKSSLKLNFLRSFQI